MNELMVFEGNKVEIIEFNGQVLFNAKDIASCLDIKNVNDNISKMNENQVIKLNNSAIGNTDIRKLNNAGENFLTESGVYKLVFKSRKPDAEKFTDWISDEVLPTIRKTGAYGTSNSLVSCNLKIYKVEQRVENLENCMTIDYEQQNELRLLGNKVAVKILGGYESPAYKEMGKKIFYRLWKDYKIYFKVNSYRNTPRIKYSEAQEYILNWQPDTNTRITIKNLNISSQQVLEVGELA